MSEQSGIGAAVAVTVAIVPREKYSTLAASVGSVLRNTTMPIELVIVLDRAAPKAAREKLDRLLGDRRDVRVIELDTFAGPFAGTNAAIAACSTPYLVVMENDVAVRPGWLDALLQCAIDEHADAVSPLILIGAADSEVIHAAGGEARIVDEPTGARYHHRQALEHAVATDVETELRRAPTELLESHCILARLTTWQHLGSLDESLGHAVNVGELALRFQRIGARTWFEPASRVVYLFGPDVKLTRSDLREWYFTWGADRIRRDMSSFADAHHLAQPKAQRRQELWWMGDHRRLWMHPLRDRIDRVARKAHLAPVGHVVWKLVEGAESATSALHSRLTRHR